MNIYESMNKAFDAEFSKIEEKRQKLTESVEVKKEVDFKPLAIPAAFAKYYKVLQPEEYMDVMGFPYEEMAETAKEYGVDDMQYIVALDDCAADLANNDLSVLVVYKDGSNIGIGQEVGGRLYPVDLEEVTGSITESVEPVEEEQAVKEEVVAEESKAEECEDSEKVLDEAKEDESDDDLWSQIYGELTMDGEQIKVGRTTQFNKGAGYDYTKQIHTGDDGAIRVEADTLEELKPAADIAIAHKGEGVTYKMRRGKKDEKFVYCIEICIPMEGIAECMNLPKMVECTNKPVKEEVEVKNEDLSPLEKLKKAYPELNI